MKLSVQSGSQSIGVWEIGSEPLSLSISDDHKVLVELTIKSPVSSPPAQAKKTSETPVENHSLLRDQGDDFTMPLPVNPERSVVSGHDISLPAAVRESFSSKVPVVDWNSSSSSAIGEQTQWTNSVPVIESLAFYEPLEIWEFSEGRWSFFQMLSTGETIELLGLLVVFEQDSGKLVFSGDASTQVVLIDQHGQREGVERVKGVCALPYGSTALIRTQEQAYCIRANQEDDSAAI